MTGSQVPPDLPDGFDHVLGELVSEWIEASRDPALSRAILRARFVLGLPEVADLLEEELACLAPRPGSRSTSVSELVVRAANCLSLHLLMLSRPQPRDLVEAARRRLSRLSELAGPRCNPSDGPVTLVRCPACRGLVIPGQRRCPTCGAQVEDAATAASTAADDTTRPEPEPSSRDACLGAIPRGRSRREGMLDRRRRRRRT